MNKKRLYIVTLEPIDQRYTKQWHSYFLKSFSKYFNVFNIDGGKLNQKISKGRFLDVNKTNDWKAVQVSMISRLFNDGKINKGDIFLFTDAWNFGIIALKYMSQLNNIPVKIYGYWHAGTWDDNDFITQVGMRDWVTGFEESLFKALDGSFVATYYHKYLIEYYHKINVDRDNIYVVGFPMDWNSEFNTYKVKPKKQREKIVVFPHRLDKEKCPEVFDKLAKSGIKAKFVKTLNVTKNKKQYYDLLSKSMVSFSASKQETFGIGTVEAMLLGCIPLVPEGLAYDELYENYFKYKDYKEAKNKLNHFLNEHYNDDYLKHLLKINQHKLKDDCLQSVSKMAKVMLHG